MGDRSDTLAKLRYAWISMRNSAAISL